MIRSEIKAGIMAQLLAAYIQSKRSSSLPCEDCVSDHHIKHASDAAEKILHEVNR